MIKPTSTRLRRTREASALRREGQKEALREQILQAASAEFVEHGYDGFSLRRVAERIGYSATTIYLHFKNKDDLLLHAVKDGFSAFDARMERAARTLSGPRARLEALGRAYIDFGLENPALYRLMFLQRADLGLLPRLIGPASTPEAEASPEPQHQVRAQELLVEAVRLGQESGEFRAGDARLSADALWASVHGLTSLAIGPLMGPDHARDVVDALLQTLLDGLAPP